MLAMPICLPPEPRWTEANRAERAVWDVLYAQLPEQALLVHSLALTEHHRDYEADLVVAYPGIGLAVMEVKGGRVSYRAGQWYQEDRHGAHRIGDPVRQAEDVKHVLLRYLGERGVAAAQARTVHLLVVPYTDVPADWELPGCPRAQVIDRSELGQLAPRLVRAVEGWGSGHRLLTAAEVPALATILARELEPNTQPATQSAEHEDRVAQMTRDQFRILDVLRYQRRLKIIGGAGTGKTWLALEQTRRLAGAGERVALVCYSRGLARLFQRIVADWPVRDQPAYAGLFHALPLAWGATLPPADPKDLEAQSEYYERGLPAQLGTLATQVAQEVKFDSIVVDEAQDFGEAWWPPTLACLRDVDQGGLFAYLDEAQRVFNRHGEVPIPLPPYVLTENIRNTKRIAQVFGSLAGEQSVYRGLDGPPVRFVACSAGDAVSAADDEVDRLLDGDHRPGDIALLVTGRRHPLQVESLNFHDWDTYWDAFLTETDVFYGHVLGFKGLERRVVILAVNGLRDPARAREYLYVGLSRARTQLIVCGDLTEITAAGGEGLRRRLQAAAS